MHDWCMALHTIACQNLQLHSIWGKGIMWQCQSCDWACHGCMDEARQAMHEQQKLQAASSHYKRVCTSWCLVWWSACRSSHNTVTIDMFNQITQHANAHGQSDDTSMAGLEHSLEAGGHINHIVQSISSKDRALQVRVHSSFSKRICTHNCYLVAQLQKSEDWLERLPFSTLGKIPLGFNPEP